MTGEATAEVSAEDISAALDNSSDAGVQEPLNNDNSNPEQTQEPENNAEISNNEGTQDNGNQDEAANKPKFLSLIHI